MSNGTAAQPNQEKPSLLKLPEEEFRALVEKAAKQSGELQLKTIYQAGYQKGREDGIAEWQEAVLAIATKYALKEKP